MKTIYVSHSTSFDYKKELYASLKEIESSCEVQFVFPHDDSSEPFDVRKLFESGECDLVLAEVSYASTGQGIELGWADDRDIPIVCISKEGTNISGSLKKVSKQFFNFKTDKEILSIVQNLKVENV